MIKIKDKFILDRKGKKKSVVLSYRRYTSLLEDLADLAVVAERRLEKPLTHKDFVAGLQKDGLL